MRVPVPVPRGLLWSLGVYAVAVGAYVSVSTWRSPDYQAARHYRAAHALLGNDEGRDASVKALTEAYEDLLEAARLEPQILALHEELEMLNERFAERRMRVPGDLRERAEAVAVLYRRIQDEQAPLLAVGKRARGWDPDQLLSEPARKLEWSLLGWLGIVVAWAALKIGERQRLAHERAQALDTMEREIDESVRAREAAVRRDPPASRRR